VDWLMEPVCLEEACVLGSRNCDVLALRRCLDAEAQRANKFCKFVSCPNLVGSGIYWFTELYRCSCYHRAGTAWC